MHLFNNINHSFTNMKRFLPIMLVLAMGTGQAYSMENVLFNESFANVEGSEEGTTVLDQSQLDNPSGWTFSEAYGGPGYLIIKKGGSVTVPACAELADNACIYFSVGPWFAPESIPNDDDIYKSQTLSITNGTLSTTTLELGVSTVGGVPYIYGGNAETRVTLTATSDIRIGQIQIFYGSTSTDNLTGYSHESGDYYKPFDLTLTKYNGNAGVPGDDGSHNILVYTLDNSEPTRKSARYDGSPIRISATTTVKSATILGNGAVAPDDARTYTMVGPEEPQIPEHVYTIALTQAGTLQDKLNELDADIIEGLTVSGPINGVDLAYLVSDKGMMGMLAYLDISDVTFVYDDAMYKSIVTAPEGGMGTVVTSKYYFSAENSYESRSTSPTTALEIIHSNNLASAFSGHKKLTRLVLPKVLTSIGAGACGGEVLAMVTLPDGITEIGAYAFGSATSNINLPQSITHIYSGAMPGFIGAVDLPNLEYVGESAFGGSKLSDFKFYSTLKYIGEGAFAGSMLEEVNIPTPPDTIPEDAFRNCPRLRSVTLGNGVRYIGSNAFNQPVTYGKCPMQEISIAESVEEIGYQAFPEPIINALPSEEGIRYINRVAVACEPNVTTANIKGGTISLCESLFGNTAVESANLPASLQIVGPHAFQGTQLKAVPAMPGVKRIGKGAFSWTNITSVPDMPGLEYIGDEAFQYCNSLVRVTLPESLKYIGSFVFNRSDALWRIDYNAIDCDAPYGIICSPYNPNTPNNLEKINVGDKVRRIPAGLFANSTIIKSVVLPQSVEIIDPNAFMYNTALTDIVLSDNIAEIPADAFSDCSSLRNVHWPLNLKSIGSNAFYKCSALTVISLPEGVTTLGDYAFSYCSNVHTVYLASTLTEFGESAIVPDNANLESMTITSTALVPPSYEWPVYYMAPAIVKVPARALEAYRNNPNWNNAKFTLTTIEEIEASTEESNTSFADGVNDETDLGDTVVGDVYVTVGEEDGYDETDGSIVLNSTMSDEHAEAIGGMAPGLTDLSNRFNGLVVMVPAGYGTVTIDCRTIGSRRLSVKIGESEPTSYVKSDKGTIDVDYDVAEDTYVYVYGSDDETQEPESGRAKVSAADNCVKIYAIGVTPKGSGIVDITTDEAEEATVIDYYTIDGKRVAAPTAPGLYIIRYSDGTTAKVIF